MSNTELRAPSVQTPLDNKQQPYNPTPFLLYLITPWAYQNHDIFHVFKLLRVEEGCELLSVGCQVPVQICCFKPPLITRKHLLEAELVCCILELLWVS